MKLFYGLFVIVLFGTLALGYSLVSSIPVTIAQAQAAVIEARSDAIIEQMYAAENVAKMTQARERENAASYVIVGAVTVILALVVLAILVTFGAWCVNRAHMVGGRSDVREINGEMWRVVEKRGEWVILEPISQYELAERRMK